MNASVIFKNAKMVLPNEVVHGSLSADNGRISAVGGDTSAMAAVDLGGDYLLPGLMADNQSGF